MPPRIFPVFLCFKCAEMRKNAASQTGTASLAPSMDRWCGRRWMAWLPAPTLSSCPRTAPSGRAPMPQPPHAHPIPHVRHNAHSLPRQHTHLFFFLAPKISPQTAVNLSSKLTPSPHGDWAGGWLGSSRPLSPRLVFR